MFFKKKRFFLLIFILFLTVIVIKETKMFSKETLVNLEFSEYAKNDSLKFKSVKFLLDNIEDKYTQSKFTGKKRDIKNIHKEYVFENIDLSILKASENLNKDIFTLDQFLQYVLPYRLEQEEIDNWRESAIDSYRACYNDDIFVLASNINNKLKKEFTYNSKEISNRNLSQIMKKPIGGCFTMSNLAAYTMRANGIPIAIDFAKWSNIKGRQQWNSLMLKSRNIPFLGAESNPNVNNNIGIITQGYKRFAKVYRKTFIKSNFINEDFDPKKIISEENYIDVTNEYCSSSMSLKISCPNNAVNKDFFYLCIYDVDQWIPVDFAIGNKSNIIFENVCPNNLFTLKKLTNNELTYFKTPFTFDVDGKISFLDNNLNKTIDLNLNFFNSNDRELINLFSEKGLSSNEFYRKRAKILKDNITGFVKKDSIYRLYVWKNKWIQIKENIAKDSIISFRNVPQNVLFKLEGNDANSYLNRCFTYGDGVQNWW